MYTIFKSLFIKVREVEIYEYLWDIMQLENSNIRQLYERTGISKIKLIHFFKSDYKKGSDTTEAIAAAIGLSNPEIPIMERIAEYYCNKLHAILGSAEETFIKYYCALPALEQRYLRIIARDITGAYLGNKNGPPQ